MGPGAWDLLPGALGPEGQKAKRPGTWGLWMGAVGAVGAVGPGDVRAGGDGECLSDYSWDQHNKTVYDRNYLCIIESKRLCHCHSLPS